MLLKSALHTLRKFDRPGTFHIPLWFLCLDYFGGRWMVDGMWGQSLVPTLMAPLPLASSGHRREATWHDLGTQEVLYDHDWRRGPWFCWSWSGLCVFGAWGPCWGEMWGCWDGPHDQFLSFFFPLKILNSFEIQFTYHQIHPFKVYDSMGFSRFKRVVQPSPLSSSRTFSSSHMETPSPLSSHTHTFAPAPGLLACLWWSWLFWTFHIKDAFCVWLLSLSVTFSRFIDVVASITLFLFFLLFSFSFKN